MVAVLACSALLAGGFVLKSVCIGRIDRGAELLCYTDIIVLYFSRGIDIGLFPYVNGHLIGNNLAGGAIEYPVLTGLLMWAIGQPVNGVGDYLRLSAVALAPFGLVTAGLLGHMTGRKALMWAAAPAVVLYAFHNWDLPVVAAVVTGVWLWARGRPAWAAVAFGIGGALKLYPLIFLLPLVLEFRHERRRALSVLGAGVGTWIAINLPIALADVRGWWLTYRFHSIRNPNLDTFWEQLFPRLDGEAVNLISAALIGLSFAAVCWWGWRRERAEGTFPFLPVAAAMLAAFLLWTKVHSPQYTLWLLPFFALLRVRPAWWVGYTVVDLVVYIGVFRYFHALALGQEHSPAELAMIVGIFARAVLLGALMFVFARSRPVDLTAPKRRPEEVVSHPSHNLSTSET